MLHLMVVHGAPCGEVSFETDRARFIGRTRSTVAPQAMTDQAGLSGSDGSVLDPIVAIRNRVMLEPDQAVTVDIVSGWPRAGMWPSAWSRNTGTGILRIVSSS